MDDKNQTTKRVVFGMEVTDSSIAVSLRGDWDMDMLEGLVAFIARQRRRLALAEEWRSERGPFICDGWENQDG